MFYVVLCGVVCFCAIRTVLFVVAKLRMTRRVTVHCSKDGAGDRAKDKSSCVKDSFVKGKDKTEDTKICRSREEGQCSKG